MGAKAGELQLAFGGFEPSLEEQCRMQGYTLGNKAEQWERCRSAMVTLYSYGIASSSEIEAMKDRLHERAIQNARPLQDGIIYPFK